MKFDYYILNTYVPELDGPSDRLYASWLEQCLLAEELGYDTTWLTEHHFRPFGGMLPNPQVLLAALAARTSRMRLGTAVSILPLHHPLRIAEDFAMLDNISGGRIDVGIGRGMPHIEYEVYGGDWPNAQSYVEESIQVILTAWTQDPFSWNGQHYHYPQQLSLMPPPVQKPHPPVWMTANREEEHFRWIGQQGFNLMTLPWILNDYALSRRLIDAYREALEEAGHRAEDHEVLAMFPAHVAATEAEARQSEVYWNNWTAMAFGERGTSILKELSYERMVAENRAIFGDPEMCRQHVRRLQAELGITHLALVHHYGGKPQAQVLESMRLFATSVAPAMRAELACQSPE